MTDELQEIEEAVIVDEPGMEIARYEPAASPTLFGTDQPDLIIAKAVGVADALRRVIRDKKLSTQIQGKEHVQVEGWTLLGTMLGVFPVTVWTHKLDNGWEARVEARTISGAIVGAAESQCTRDEKTWRERDEYAIRSMAQTRATSKALRVPLGFVMSLAGFEATPEAEMPSGGSEKPQDAPKAPAAGADQPHYAESSGAEYVFNFGKHSGKRLIDVEEEDPQYIDWLSKAVDVKGKMATAKAAALAWLEEKAGLQQIPFS